MKQLIVLFNKPLALPSDEGDKITTYGLYLDKTDRATFYNIKEYVLNYICVISQLYKNEKVKSNNSYVFETDREKIVIWDPTWEKYAEKARETGMEFAIIDDGDLEIKEDDRYLIFITQKGLWEYLKGKNGLVWNK